MLNRKIKRLTAQLHLDTFKFSRVRVMTFHPDSSAWIDPRFFDNQSIHGLAISNSLRSMYLLQRL
jgi:hypothetical protein